ncbi:CPBP family intramembrane glutamic endopeptidase [Rhodopirellula sp. JC639]|uniref:CPBP family intramembrane glutamic endopeptidase n=1 Tax=Stieleria mannarensis TaxID=2755585 RepID=UPI0016029FF7|nr:CPBP family intramembrane glutamic endopeptidase [Rhodopirellula sp. JC639]
MQRETLFQAGFFAISLTVLAVVAAGSLLWIGWFAGWRKRNLCGDASEHLITPLPQHFPRWSVFDFLLMFGTMILVGSLLHQTLATDVPVDDAVGNAAVVDQAPPQDEAPVIEEKPAAEEQTAAEEKPVTAEKLVTQVQVHFTANLAALGLTLIFLRLTQSLTLAELSLIPNWNDVRRGLFATVWILTPVLLINFVVSNLVPYEHTVTDLMAEQTGLQTFLALLLSAAVVTPIVEEVQFRLLLQGGLQRIADLPVSALSPNSPPPTAWHPTSAWPVYATSVLFAAMHLGQGAAPVPLFFLSVGLGFLYQRTGRLVPAIVVHMLLNAATLCMEFCRVNAGL